MTGFVYFLGASAELVKIGWAKNPWDRIRLLQTGHPHQLQLYALARGTMQDESTLHSHFSYLNARGEWFRVDARLCLLMKLLGANIGFASGCTREILHAVYDRFENLIDRAFTEEDRFRATRRLMRRL